MIMSTSNAIGYRNCLHQSAATVQNKSKCIGESTTGLIKFIAFCNDSKLFFVVLPDRQQKVRKLNNLENVRDILDRLVVSAANSTNRYGIFSIVSKSACSLDVAV